LKFLFNAAVNADVFDRRAAIGPKSFDSFFIQKEIET